MRKSSALCLPVALTLFAATLAASVTILWHDLVLLQHANCMHGHFDTYGDAVSAGFVSDELYSSCPMDRIQLGTVRGHDRDLRRVVALYM